MAKKKSESTEKSAPKKSPAKKGGAKKAAAPAGNPMVNTTLAAQNAAKLLAAGLPHKAGGTSTAMQPESSTFKNLKQGLAKPHLSGLDGILNKSAPPDTKRSNQPYGVGKQVGHNQTFGADVNRTGVPRRTPG